VIKLIYFKVFEKGNYLSQNKDFASLFWLNFSINNGKYSFDIYIYGTPPFFKKPILPIAKN